MNQYQQISNHIDQDFIIINIIQMSSIIDDYISSKFTVTTPTIDLSSEEYFVEELAKKVNSHNGYLLVQNNVNCQQSSLKILLEKRQYHIRLKSQKHAKNLVVYGSQIQSNRFGKVWSKNIEIELIRQLCEDQRIFQNQCIYYSRFQRIFMVLKIYLYFSFLPRRKLIDAYIRIISKNVLSYHKFLTTSFKDMKSKVIRQQKETQFREQLLITSFMNTFANFDYSQTKSQYNFSERNLKRQKLQIKNIYENIILEKDFQKNVEFLYIFKHIQNNTSWIKNNFIHFTDIIHRKYKNIFDIKRIGQKKIDQFVYNQISAEIKEKIQKPFAVGGSCQIYRMKIEMSFVNSLDFGNSYEQKRQRIKKQVAVKILKNEYKTRLKHKLQHQKNVIVKLRGSISYYLPKYYGTSLLQTFNNCIFMELINGQLLDNFIRLRSETITFKTKTHLLLNIVHGVRHLIKYSIVHLDLKPINILVCRQLITKIIDFGQAYHPQVCSKQYIPGFTFPYASPEVCRKYQNKRAQKDIDQFSYSQTQDMFAFGMIMHQVFFKSHLFEFNHHKYRQVYSSGNLNNFIFMSGQRLQEYGQASTMCALLQGIFRCWDLQGGKRPKFDWIGVLFKIIVNNYKPH